MTKWRAIRCILTSNCVKECYSHERKLSNDAVNHEGGDCSPGGNIF